MARHSVQICVRELATKLAVVFFCYLPTAERGGVGYSFPNSINVYRIFADAPDTFCGTDYIASCRERNNIPLTIATISSPKPRRHILHRLAGADPLHAFDTADDVPDDGEQQDERADHNQHARRADQAVKRPDPEGADLVPVMGLHPVGGGVLVDIGHDHPDQRGDAHHEAGEI